MGLLKRLTKKADGDILDQIIALSANPVARSISIRSMQISIKGSCKDNIKTFTKEKRDVTKESITQGMRSDAKYMEAVNAVGLDEAYILSVAEDMVNATNR